MHGLIESQLVYQDEVDNNATKSPEQTNDGAADQLLGPARQPQVPLPNKDGLHAVLSKSAMRETN